MCFLLPCLPQLGYGYFHPISTNKKAPYHYGAFALFLSDVGQQVDDLVGIAPLIIVPGHHLYKGVG